MGELRACCFVLCATDAAWRGPFWKIAYGNCGNYGKYYCMQRGLAYEGAKWDNC
ncbi:hypothetical protein LXT21_15145 [Myxococcus sp. K38C18041901]|uniref:hypothetical protein n=1 Tax=Myxococcus guangdongensis TaxID=2906760 RepID=UPI0020A73C21|nr:hypothetical protein [Myxococcus guangdongensis]MCP3060118.1 hypothetical protein [Myxococcus guangdongensis]